MKLIQGQCFRARNLVSRHERGGTSALLSETFVCKGPAAPTQVGGVPGRYVPIEIGTDTHYVTEGDADDANNWELARPTKGTSKVPLPDVRTGAPTAEMHRHVDGHLTPIDDGRSGYAMAGFGYEARDRNGHRSDWRTEVTWGPKVPGFVQPEGEWMEARKLGPDHPMGRDPTEHTRANSNALKALTRPEKWIGGHMLNDNLGGTGDDPANIVAIPEYTNKLHSKKVEEKIKTAVNEEGRWVYYKFQVTGHHDTGELHGDGTKKQYASGFRTTWHELDHTGGQLGAAHVDEFTIPRMDKLVAKVNYATANEDQRKFYNQTHAGTRSADAMTSMISTGSPWGRPLEKKALMHGVDSFPRPPANPIDAGSQVYDRGNLFFRSDSIMGGLAAASVTATDAEDGWALDVDGSPEKEKEVKKLVGGKRAQDGSQIGKLKEGFVIDDAIEHQQSNRSRKASRRLAPSENQVEILRQTSSFNLHQLAHGFGQRDVSRIDDAFNDVHALDRGANQAHLREALRGAYERSAEADSLLFLQAVVRDRMAYKGPVDLITWLGTY